MIKLGKRFKISRTILDITLFQPYTITEYENANTDRKELPTYCTEKLKTSNLREVYILFINYKNYYNTL